MKEKIRVLVKYTVRKSVVKIRTLLGMKLPTCRNGYHYVGDSGGWFGTCSKCFAKALDGKL